HFYRFLPSQLIFFGSAGLAGEFYLPTLDRERLARKDLHVDEMEMDRMRISRKVEDTPNLRRACLHNFRRAVLVSERRRQSAEQLRQPAVGIEPLVKTQIAHWRSRWQGQRRHWA